MDKIIEKNISKISLSGSELIKLVDGKTNVIRYSDLSNYKDIDDVVEYSTAIILYRTNDNYGHWTCIIKHNGYYEFFDPYGMYDTEILNMIGNKTNVNMGQNRPYLTELFLKSPYNVIYNDYKLQKINKQNNNTCGRWVALRIQMKDIKLNKFVKLMTTNKYNPDTMVSMLTAFVN